MKPLSSQKKLIAKLKSRKAKVAVVGLGYVGLPLVCEFASHGFTAKGIDVDTQKILAIREGRSYIGDIESEWLKKLVKGGKLSADNHFDFIEEADAVIICVPTPLNRSKDPDISFILSVTDEIKKRIHPGQLVVLESTTYPGTTEEVILPALQQSGLVCGRDFFLCFSPERVDPGNPNFKTRDITKVVGGVTPDCTEVGKMLYSQVIKRVFTVSTSRTAEMTKLLENTFRIVNIGLINELARAADSLGVNIWEAVEAASTKPFGFMPFYPGPGIGGHCIGIDPLYLSWKARLHGEELHFIELARRMNAEMPKYVVTQAVYALNQKLGKAVSRSKILLLGMSYKKDVSDVRESPALDILHELKELGAEVNYHDPHVPEITEGGLRLKSLPLTDAVLAKQDLVVLTTNHTVFNRQRIVKKSRLIYDTRNFFQDIHSDNIVRL
ncbi:MAG: nucleotide sugar dehydrogenase [Candidatus Omnitrophica bacterium]|nr:nucleotide sugar dehydrogenase [Candidatus Omnitrophota bacterium]